LAGLAQSIMMEARASRSGFSFGRLSAGHAWDERWDLQIGNTPRGIVPMMPAQPRPEILNTDRPIPVDLGLDFCRTETRKAHAYWDSIRGERAMPARGDLRPRGMREFISYVNLVDTQRIFEGDSLDYQISLEAQHTRNVFGHLTLQNIKKGMLPERVRRARECFELVRTTARPARIQSRVTVRNQFWLASESLLAPLGDHAGQVTAIMWVFVSWEAVAR
jgi:hypothetical protein